MLTSLYKGSNKNMNKNKKMLLKIKIKDVNETGFA
jgi:hypothetical protein